MVLKRRNLKQTEGQKCSSFNINNTATFKAVMKKITLSRYEVISVYKKTYSVTEVLKHFGCPRGNSDMRMKINDILKEEGIFEGNSGPNVNRLKQEKIKKTMLKKYGVDNYSYTKGGTTNLHNHREKSSFPIVESFREYQRQVNIETKKVVRKIKDRPSKCEYLGLDFVDDNIANPNDQLKRTIDHKKSVYNCWLEGISVKEASSPDNLAWVCRYINSIKGNADYNDIKHIFSKIKNKLC